MGYDAVGPAKKSKMSEDEMKWRAEDDLRTYERWLEVKRDPKRMKAMKACAKEKLARLQGAIKQE